MNGGSSETVEVEYLIATSVLDNDKIPNDNQSETCFSCEATMLGLFCKDCGQKNDNFRRSIFFLIVETFSNIFSFESRIWRTWWSLLRHPGKAAREFADGKRTIWTAPVRIYLAMSIILFGYMSLTDTRLISIRTDIEAREGVVGDVQNLSDNQVRLSPEIRFFARQKQLDALNENVDFDRTERLIKGIPHARFALVEDEKLVEILTSETAKKEFARGFVDGLKNVEDPNELRDALDDKLSEIDKFGDLTSQILDEIDEAAKASEAEKTRAAETGEEPPHAKSSGTSTQAKNNEENADVSDATPEQQALDLIMSKRTKAVRQLNRLLGHYEDIQSVATGLSEGTIPLTTEALIHKLPTNLTIEKRTSIAETIPDVINQLEEAGITSATLPHLTLKLEQKGALFFHSLTVGGSKLTTGEIQEVVMTILRRPAILNEAFATYLPRIMFFMMPFAMFIGIIFIRDKKRALMYDHLVHAAYIHAFTYLFLLVLIILSQWANIANLDDIFLIGMLIYLPISAKHMFQRGWFKTVLTSYSIAFQYSLVIFFILIALLVTQMNRTLAGI